MALNLVPNSGQSLDETRVPIRDNFSFINSGFLANHVELNSGVNSGKHKAVIMVNQTVAPTAPVTLLGESAIYAAPSLVAPNASAIFIKNGASATTVDGIEITYALEANDGWTRLPSGILMVWGQKAVPINSRATATFAKAFTALPYSVQVTGKRTTVNPADPRGTLESFTMTQATFGNSSATDAVTIYYLAIGV